MIISLGERIDHINLGLLRHGAGERPNSPPISHLQEPRGQEDGTPQRLACSCAERSACAPAEESLLDISLEEGMDRMDLGVLHREAAKRARSINPSISDLRLAVDAAAEMQARPCSPAPSLLKPAAAFHRRACCCN